MNSFVFLLLLNTLCLVLGYPWLQKQQIISVNNTVDNQKFGQAVLLKILSPSTGTLFIGAPGVRTISTYEYDGTQYAYQSAFQCCADSPGISFSLAVSGDGNTLGVGTPNTGFKSGRGYIFTRQPDNSWSPIFTDGNCGSVPATGVSVALSDDGNVFAVNADNKVCIYVNSLPWNQVALIGLPSMYSSGVQVAMSASATTGSYAYVAVGAAQDSATNGTIFTYYCQDLSSGTCSNAYTIPNPSPSNTSQFGRSLSMGNNGTLLAVGSLGAVYIYQLSTFGSNVWNYVQTIADAAIFGSPVSLSSDGSVLSVGATDSTGNTTDIVYTYQWYSNQFSAVPSLNGTDPSTGHNNFGTGISVLSQAEALVVGASQELYNGLTIGASYVYAPATPSATASATTSSSASSSGSASSTVSAIPTTSANPSASSFPTSSSTASGTAYPTSSRSADPATHTATRSADATSSATQSATATGSSTGTTTASSSPQHSESKSVVDTAVFAGSLSAAGIVVLISIGAAISCYWQRVARANLQRAGFHVTYGTTGPQGSVLGPQSGSADAPHGYVTL